MAACSLSAEVRLHRLLVMLVLLKGVGGPAGLLSQEELACQCICKMRLTQLFGFQHSGLTLV